MTRRKLLAVFATLPALALIGVKLRERYAAPHPRSSTHPVGSVFVTLQDGLGPYEALGFGAWQLLHRGRHIYSHPIEMWMRIS